MNYTKGLHIIADITTHDPQILIKAEPFHQVLAASIDQLGLHSVGAVLHNFDTGGFTISVCLTESHICAHTWPEFGIVTLDIYLSNTYQVNDEKGRQLLEICKDYFNTAHIKVQEIFR